MPACRTSTSPFVEDVPVLGHARVRLLAARLPRVRPRHRPPGLAVPRTRGGSGSGRWARSPVAAALGRASASARTRYARAARDGVLCGLAGAQLSISLVTQFVVGMTAGRGFIALVAVMFGRAHPLGVLGRACCSGSCMRSRCASRGAACPPQFVAMLPYVATIVVLVLFAVRGAAAGLGGALRRGGSRGGAGGSAQPGVTGEPWTPRCARGAPGCARGASMRR